MAQGLSTTDLWTGMLKKERPFNLIYITKEPIFWHIIYEPPKDEEGGGQGSMVWSRAPTDRGRRKYSP